LRLLFFFFSFFGFFFSASAALYGLASATGAALYLLIEALISSDIGLY